MTLFSVLFSMAFATTAIPGGDIEITPTAAGCDWRVTPNGTDAPVLLGNTACPRKMAWSSAGDAVTVLTDTEVFRVAWTLPFKAERIAAAPDEEVLSFWTDASTGEARVGLLRRAERSCSGRTCTYTEAGRAWTTHIDRRGFEAFVSDQGITRAPRYGEDRLLLPDWGEPSIAVALSWRDGAWTEVAAAPTRSHACDTPGLMALQLVDSAVGTDVDVTHPNGTRQAPSWLVRAPRHDVPGLVAEAPHPS
jgi:hypothetical protein